MLKKSFLLAIALMLCVATFAQVSAPKFPADSKPMVTNINKNSYPRLLPDNRVMFGILAPEAKLVQIDLCQKKYPMTKDEKGFWTVTTDVQVPGFHYYNLIIDGVSVADPASESFYGCSRMSSAIDIPEEGTEDFEIQDVPHGEFNTVNYFSKVDNAWRPLRIYTPAGYNESKEKYPVIYIQHGGGEDHRGWAEQGRTAMIMDNLIASGRAVKAIVVCSNSNLTNTSGYRGGWEGNIAFRNEMIDNIIPFVEKNYRVIADREHRALCGLSMGGGISFYVGLRSPEVFGSVGVFSSGMFGIDNSSNLDFEKEIPGMFSQTKKFNNQFKLFFISCGEQDPRINHATAAVEQMRSKGVKIEYFTYPGDHEWQVWRKSLKEFAQKVFKK